MTIDASTPLRAVAMAVCTALDHAGVTAVLTGGSAATCYAPEAYQSSDIDFIAVRFGGTTSRGAVDSQLAAIGFRRAVDCYRHPESPYPIEFPPGPLAVGRELLTSWRTIREGDGILHILHPTDSVKDRLAAFIHWNDRAGLSQALAVARAQSGEIDVLSIEAWAEGEGGRAKFADFLERLGGGSTGPGAGKAR